MQIIQMGPKRLQIIQNNVKIVHDNDVPIYNVALCPPNFTIYSGQSMFIQEMGPNGLATNSGSFESPSQQLAMSAQTVYSFNDDQTKIRCHSLAGVEKQILSLGGFSVKMTINGNYLAAAIVPSTVKVFDLARREAKQTVHRDLTTLGSDIGVVTDIAVNCAANRLSMTTDNGRGESSSRIHIYAPDRQKMFSYDINDENEGQNEDNLDRFYPLNMKWDEHDKQLLAIEYASSSEHLVVLVWSTDSEVVSQERIAFPKDGRKFLSLCTPNLHFSTTDSEIRKVPLQDFVGLTECDKTTRVALLDFSRQMALGDLDSAFNSIKLIKNETVWLNLAKRCVYTKRIDVAQVCLANMGNAAAAAALRKVQNEEPVEARVAMLAMQLGMNKEAEELYIQSKRFDLLNKFYQAVGRWDDALTTAKKSDRLHLRSTHYNFAKKCEWEKEYEQAVGHYEESKTHLFEIPRMLFDEPERLKSYVQKNTDMNKWWAQYMEYTGEFEEAEKYYKQCGDYLALARVLCVKEDFNEADKLANETGDSAACLHMARHHELAGDVKQAIHFYTRAGAYNNVIRICKEHGFEDQLFNVALLSQPRDMLLAADHFQKNESTLDKAVLLYHRAGNLAKAIDLVFQQQRFGVLEQLVDELDHSAPPEVLSRCAKFFLEHGRSAKAAHLFILSKSYPRAMQIIIEEDVDMSPRMVELLNLPPGCSSDVPGREKIMKAAAQHCYDKTQFADAAKLFQHAGLRQEAMKCLARLGDVKKMVEFAQLARDPSLFILAGNYLRSTNAWQEDPAILKAIVTFYRKARKLDLMTTFFIECAQHQIDSASDYDQALGLLQQAVKQLQSSKADTSEQINILREKAIDYKKFTDVVKAMKSSPSDGIDMVSALMREVHEGNSCVRMADLAAFCVKFHASTNPTKATEYLKLIQKDSDRHVTEFVDAETIKKLKASIAASRAAAQTESEAIE
ncbi:unnamed protein product [Oikopleura dioica]|uniref:Uncharacterized protein n=1 Tax=Oikopleura dioica TaxID=34765 RepID=E4YJ84_OIKDI|nr:unnamed protein product [Oikopleura dioica]